MRAAREGHGFSVYRYHDVMVKAGRRGDGAPFAHVRHEYAFDESVSSEGMWDCFCIEPMEDGSTIACENFSPSYGLSSSLGRAV